MSLAKLVATSPPARPRTGIPCSVGNLLHTLAGDDLAALLLILYGDTRARGGRGRSASEVFELLEQAGHPVSRQQINRHRGGVCRCEGDA